MQSLLRLRRYKSGRKPSAFFTEVGINARKEEPVSKSHRREKRQAPLIGFSRRLRKLAGIALQETSELPMKMRGDDLSEKLHLPEPPPASRASTHAPVRGARRSPPAFNPISAMFQFTRPTRGATVVHLMLIFLCFFGEIFAEPATDHISWRLLSLHFR